MTSTAREITINLRAPSARRALIDQAAEISGKTRSQFMLDAACEKAQRVFLDQTVFALDQVKFRRFTQLLDAPPGNRSAVRQLLNRRAPWDVKPR